jgi:hypothetical protein
LTRITGLPLGGLPGRADRLAPLPIDGEVLRGKAFVLAPSAVIIAARRSQQVNVIPGAAGQQAFGIDIAGIGQMHRRQQIIGGQGIVDRLKSIAVSHPVRQWSPRG